MNKIENILIVDTETTGLEPTKGAQLIEVGAILYNVPHRTILQNFSTLLPCASNEAEHINNIKAEWTRCNKPTDISYNQLNAMADSAQYLVAHNAKFDKKFVSNYRGFVNTKWICTKEDFKWPVLLNRMRLQDICMAMGVEYTGAHRALADCQFIARCFDKIGDLEDRLTSAATNNLGNSNRYR